MTRNYPKKLGWADDKPRKNFALGGATDEELKAIPTRMLSSVEAKIMDDYLGSTADKPVDTRPGLVSGIACFSERYLPTSRQARELTRADREGKKRSGDYEHYDAFAKGGVVKKPRK